LLRAWVRIGCFDARLRIPHGNESPRYAGEKDAEAPSFGESRKPLRGGGQGGGAKTARHAVVARASAQDGDVEIVEDAHRSPVGGSRGGLVFQLPGSGGEVFFVGVHGSTGLA